MHMGAMTDYLRDDHRHCDELLAVVEQAISKGNWQTAAARWQEFQDATLRHFAAEEEILFPAFEEATGMLNGPTAVMRGEHAHMRALLASLAAALSAQRANDFLGDADTLTIMLQQHNMKEEGMLYPMSERVLRDVCDTLVGAMQRMEAGTASV
jgi:hemerythrin-like domain-containing protein